MARMSKKEKLKDRARTDAEQQRAFPLSDFGGKKRWLVPSVGVVSCSCSSDRRHFLFPDAERAAYFGKQFARLWADYLLPSEYKINDNE